MASAGGLTLVLVTAASAGGAIAAEPETDVGVIIDGQRDNLPDAESDNETLTEIAQSLDRD